MQEGNSCNPECDRCVGKEFIIHLKEHISSERVNQIWDWLPETYRKREDILELLPCYEHYNLPSSRTHIDGPAPSKKNCGACRKIKCTNNVVKKQK
jgi:hypothetical protein